ncbi:MAG: hypothetical protein JJE55_12735 [Flavobacteriaceae bacterium]|nr:hypothetical protein [Flavobacteriaceae bacterium]
MLKTACFFTNEPLEAIEQEQYSIQDINILKDLGFTGNSKTLILIQIKINYSL